MKFPAATPQPKSVRFGRVSYMDSFQWLEEESPESLRWQSEQDKLAQEWLGSQPSRARIKNLMADNPRLNFDVPQHYNGRWFRQRTPENQDFAVVEVADALEGPWRRIVDLNEMYRGEPLSFGAFVVSPDGRKVLYAFAAGGREDYQWRVIDVDTGRVLLDAIKQVRPLFPAFTPDSKAIYYSAYDPAGSMTQVKVYRQVLGEEPVTRPEDIETTHPVVWATRAADKRHMILLADHLNPRPDYIRDEVSGRPWQPFLKGEAFLIRGDIIGDQYVAITNDNAPCGRLVSIPLATPRDRSTWKELVPPSENVLASMLVVDNHVVLHDLVDCYSRIRVFSADGRLKGELPLPARGAVSFTHYGLFNFAPSIWAGKDGDLLFPFSTLAQSPATYKANVHTLKVEALGKPAVKIDAVIHDYAATSADGARVPYRVVARAGLDLSRPQPAIIHGYGGFGVSIIPGWTASFFGPWIRAGGVLVLAHLRGGGELGPDMWHNGRLQHKQNSFNDVYAIAEDLIRRNISAPSQLGFTGGSNGGVVAATAAVQRPELFRAILPQSPITDILARARDPITMAATLDYGDPNDPEMSEVLLAWSPYQNIKDGVSYPALYLECGKNDPRCPAWHGRKMAARMQQASKAPYPALLRVRADAGHGVVGVEAQRELDADFMTFFVAELGLAV
jgi:prolyl oligopeptidase